MRLFRNPEWKRLFLICLACTVLSAGIGWIVNFTCFLFALCLCVLLSCVALFLYARHLGRISALTHYVERVLRGDMPLKPGKTREGEYAILENELYKLSAALYAQLEKTEEERKRLSDALSDISHQIKTPLTALTIECQLLRGEENEKESRLKLIRSMDAQLQRVEKLVEMLLKMSRMDAGAVQFTPETLSADVLLQKALSPLLIPLELRNVTVKISGAAEDCVCCDPAWTAEALGAILKNCMEHTPAGGEITICHRETPLMTSFTLMNSGPAIAENDLPHIFERFFRGQHAAPGSAGIGLSFARQVISGQSGTLSAKNKENHPRFSVVFYKHTV